MLVILREIATRASWPPLLVFGVHAAASLGLNAYESWPALDVPMHLLGGVAIAAFLTRSLDVLEEHALLDRSKGPLRFLLVVSLTTTAAVVWEFAEFLLDARLDTGAQVSLPDTMLDLALGMVGGLLVAGGGALRRRRP